LDVIAKLGEMRIIPGAIDQVVTHLIRENYLNEERFSQTFARGKFNQKSWGRNRIISELIKRNISKFNIKRAISGIDDESYKEKLDLLAKKRLKQFKEGNPQIKKRKLAAYLLYRGWEPQLVYDKIAELLK